MERLCLEELTEYLVGRRLEIIAKWKTMRNRAGGNDLFDAWDLGVLTRTSLSTRLSVFAQVKSQYRPAEFRRLFPLKVGDECYLAVYGKEPKGWEFKLPHFWMVRV